MTTKTGILGGTFNPVHIGHVRMALEVAERLGLDRVELVPAHDPPHKESLGLLPYDLRMELAQAAVEGVDGVVVSDIESRREGPSFTCDTMHCYRTERPREEYHFIMGAGTFLELPTWRHGLTLPSLATIIVVNRWEAGERMAEAVQQFWPGAEMIAVEQGEAWKLPDGGTVRGLGIPRLDIKAGDIRRRFLDHTSIRYLVPESVEALLEQRRGEIDAIWRQIAP